MGLRQIDEGLWVAEDDNFVGFGAWFPVRMTVARVGEGLWVHSPIALEGVAAEIDALGPVRWIVNPCGFHGKWAADAVARWPEAQLLCSSAHGRLGTRLPDYADLDPEGPAEWAEVFDSLLVQGCPKVAETVFLHRATRTLIVTDLLFNIHESKAFLMPLVLRMAGAWKRPAQSRLWRLFTKDRGAAGAAAAELLTWDFDRVVMAHGEILEDRAKEQVAEALAWMRAGALPTA